MKQDNPCKHRKRIKPTYFSDGERERNPRVVQCAECETLGDISLTGRIYWRDPTEPTPKIQAWFLKLGGAWVEPGENRTLHANSDVIFRPTQLVSTTSENENQLEKAMHTYGKATQRAMPTDNPDSSPIREFIIEQIRTGLNVLLQEPMPLESNLIHVFKDSIWLRPGEGFSLLVKNIDKTRCYLQCAILGPRYHETERHH